MFQYYKTIREKSEDGDTLGRIFKTYLFYIDWATSSDNLHQSLSILLPGNYTSTGAKCVGQSTVLKLALALRNRTWDLMIAKPPLYLTITDTTHVEFTGEQSDQNTKYRYGKRGFNTSPCCIVPSNLSHYHRYIKNPFRFDNLLNYEINCPSYMKHAQN